MSDQSKQDSRTKSNNLYTEKPATELGFKKAVAWFGGRELIASIKDIITFDVFGENMDPRSWMKANIYPGIYEEFLDEKKRHFKESLEEKLISQLDFDKIFPADNPKAANAADAETMYTVISTTAGTSVEADAGIVSEACEKVAREWAKKVFDQWEWKKNYYAVWDEFLSKERFRQKLQPDKQEIKEFWFDFIADSGDGQLGVYNVASLCLSDLWLDKEELENGQTEIEVTLKPPKSSDLEDKILLPRGAFLFVGGDTAYHTANYATLLERFQHPFRWAFTDVRKFNEEFYKLKPEKIAESEKFADQFFKTRKKEKHLIKDSLDGSLPGKILGVEYYDTEPNRPIFGIPANHDYYDGIDGFNRQFRRPPFEDIEENVIFEATRGKLLLQLPTFSRKQEASYIALCLPFNWWFLGIDSENKKLDFRQELYFQKIVKMNAPRKLIVATPEPTTVFGKVSVPDDKTAVYMKTLLGGLGLRQPFLEDGQFVPLTASESKDFEQPADLSGEFCRLDLSGDVHHYARYWGEPTRLFDSEMNHFCSDNYASLVAGGGGAFFDVTKTLIGRPLNRQNRPRFKDKDIKGEIPPQKVFPSEQESVSKTADKLFDIINIRRGGYVQLAGFAIAAILFYFLNYFSNFPDVLRNYHFVNPLKSEVLRHSRSIILLLMFMLSGIFTFITTRKVSRLIKELKDKSFRGQLSERTDASIKQLAWKYVWLACALPFYVGGLATIFDNSYPISQIPDLDEVLNSLNLIVVVINVLLLLWLSSEHTNWLTLRFKIVRKYKRKTVTQKLEDQNYTNKNTFYRILGWLMRLYSYQYTIPNLLIAAAIALLVTGIRIFARADFARTLADITVMITIAGFFTLIVIGLALGMGAQYHKRFKYKVIFTLLGLWHYILQIATPLVMFMYGSWCFLAINLIIIILFHGSALLSFFVRQFIVKNNKESKWEAFADFRIAAQITKYFNRYALFAVWLGYGLFILLIPVIGPPHSSIYGSIQNFFAKYATTLPGFDLLRIFFQTRLNIESSIFTEKFVEYVVVLTSILIVGYLGFVMSRIWFGWYLAVSMMFDGHNNEVGGAARIEGFKHIVRVRLKEDEMTVYVIGFDEAKVDMRNLNLKLVDKFTLKCRPVAKSE